MGVISATENEFAMHLVVRGQHRVRFPFYCYAPTAYPCIVNALLLLPIADRKRGWGRGFTVYPKESGFGRTFSYAESKIFGQAFFKRLAVSKGSALVAYFILRNPLYRRALRRGMNLQNDPADRFAKRGRPAREGAPLFAACANGPPSEQEGSTVLFTPHSSFRHSAC